MAKNSNKNDRPETPPEVVPPTPAGRGNGSDVPPPNPPTPAADPPPDPFNPASLRLSQDFLSGGVKKHLTTVPVRKPTHEEFVRVRPEAEFTLDTLILELKDSREWHVIAPALRDELSTEPTVSPRRLHTAITRQGALFLWPTKLPPKDGRTDRWSESMLEIVDAAKTDWVRVQSDMGVGAYIYSTP